jgi:hypothetical protein
MYVVSGMNAGIKEDYVRSSFGQSAPVSIECCTEVQTSSSSYVLAPSLPPLPPHLFHHVSSTGDTQED